MLIVERFRNVVCVCLFFFPTVGSGADSAALPEVPASFAADVEPSSVAQRWISERGAAAVGASSAADSFGQDTGGSFGFRVAFDGYAQVGLTALMLYDTAQTVTIARNPDCLREGNPLAFFGNEHPSQKEVLLTNALYIVGHWLLARKLDDLAQRSDSWAGARRVYQVLTLLGHGGAVANNVALGIRPFSNYSCAGREL